MVPKLVAEDIPLLFSLLNDVFPQVSYSRAEMTGNFQLSAFGILIIFPQLDCNNFFSKASKSKLKKFAKKNILCAVKETNKVALGWKR